MSHIPANSQIKLSPINNNFYIVFNNPGDAFDTTQRLDIAPKCFDGYDNAILLSDWMAKMHEALALNAALIERAGSAAKLQQAGLSKNATPRAKPPHNFLIPNSAKPSLRKRKHYEL